VSFLRRPQFKGPSVPSESSGGAPSVERAALDSMVPLLDGRRTTEEIFGVLLNSGFELEPVFGAYNFLEDRGLLIEALVDDGLTHEERTRYARQMTEFSEFPLAWRPSTSTETLPDRGLRAQLSLKAAHVTVVGKGVVSSYVMEMMARAGFGRITEVGEPERYASEHKSDLIIYCPDRFDEIDCTKLNALALATQSPLLLYRRYRFAVEVGPLIIPKETACYRCLVQRRAGAHADGALTSAPGTDEHALNIPLGAEMLTYEAIKRIAALGEPVTQSRIWRLNLLSGVVSLHSVLKLPRCEACGNHKVRPPQRLWEE
jgi:bacteriocin biosynthesis cyclodehydratase domain-containing protein